MPTVGAGNKCISLKRPFCFAMLALARVSYARKVHVNMQHVSGLRNEWADAISRLNESPASARLAVQFDPSRRLTITMLDVLKFGTT